MCQVEGHRFRSRVLVGIKDLGLCRCHSLRSRVGSEVEAGIRSQSQAGIHVPWGQRDRSGVMGWDQRPGVGSEVIGRWPAAGHAPSASAVFAQPIVSRARPELLHSHFIPTIGRLRKRAGKVVAEEEQLRLEAKAEAEEGELLVRDEFSVLCRDLYALYPLLIRYVDNNRSAVPSRHHSHPSMTSHL